MIVGAVNKALQPTGYKVIKADASYPDFEADFWPLYERCKPFTMTSTERMYALYQAVNYVLASEIPGDFVECGVWRGGSSMLIALTLAQRGVKDRNIYLYDTFAGMSEPTEQDVDFVGGGAATRWRERQRDEQNEWCFASLGEVQGNMLTTGYPQANVRFVQGKVEETIPATLPETIALLRLDTDWYESTYHELVHLYPRLAPQGPLILDDYGHWQGARQATDRYFQEQGITLLLNRIDYTGRIGIKL
jgi:O-methyltransferase